MSRVVAIEFYTYLGVNVMKKDRHRTVEGRNVARGNAKDLEECTQT